MSSNVFSVTNLYQFPSFSVLFSVSPTNPGTRLATRSPSRTSHRWASPRNGGHPQVDNLALNPREDGEVKSTVYDGRRHPKPASPRILPNPCIFTMRVLAEHESKTGSDTLAERQDAPLPPMGKPSQGGLPQGSNKTVGQSDSSPVTPTRGDPSSPATEWLDSTPKAPRCSGSEPSGNSRKAECH